MQPTYLVSELIRSGELVTVLPQWRPEDLKIYVLYASRKHQSAAVRALIDHLQQWFQQPPWRASR
jgi:DNA-binding transcriptional LysR family regulator